MKVVQKRLGHASAAITLDTYGHLMPDSDDRTRDVMAAALSAPADILRTATARYASEQGK
jgi:integrase